MPVRIYDIAKKLGIESKEVLVKAKDLGITAAKVPSSSLDKITAEYLEEQLGGVRPKPPEPIPAPAAEPIIITAPSPAVPTPEVPSPAPAVAEMPAAPAVEISTAPLPA